jgi:hypothetical protein
VAEGDGEGGMKGIAILALFVALSVEMVLIHNTIAGYAFCAPPTGAR